MKRHKMSKHASKKNFSKHAMHPHPKNNLRKFPAMRGGIRL